MIYDLIIVGGGAAGLVCANLAKQRGLSFQVLEKQSRPAKKIRVSGNGKCNLTNLNMNPSFYNNEFTAYLIEKYPPQTVMGFFEKMGMKLKTFGERVYPYNECSFSVVDFLLRDILGNVVCDYEVENIQKKEDIFIINNSLRARNLFFATGTDATMGFDSLYLLKALGHSVKPFQPSLVWLKTNKKYIKGLEGIRAKAKVTLFEKTKKVAVEEGEILFKPQGISGIAVFMLSAYVARKEGDYSLEIDFCPNMTEKEIENYDLQGLVRKEIAQNIVRQARDNKQDWKKTVKNFEIKILSPAEKKFCQVLTGGVNLDEINPKTMMSKLLDNLYIGGECMDVDGQCGGYNLHWAFISAMAAIDNITKK